MSALVDGKWAELENAESLGVDAFSFGQILSLNGKQVISDMDLSKNGFDYVMQQRPLEPDEDFEGWMFFKSDLKLSGQSLYRIKRFRMRLFDSAEQEYNFTSDFPAKRSHTLVSPGQINIGPIEEVLPTLQEEPPMQHE